MSHCRVQIGKDTRPEARVLSSCSLARRQIKANTYQCNDETLSSVTNKRYVRNGRYGITSKMIGLKHGSSKQYAGHQGAVYSDSDDDPADGTRSKKQALYGEDQVKNVYTRLHKLQEDQNMSKDKDVRGLVETSMLAALAGLSYTFATLLKLEGYLSYVLPLPVVLCSVRSGIISSLHCVVVIFLLLFILMGPVRAVTYVLVYGLLSLALGISFRANLPWTLSVPLGACSRLTGQWLYIMVTSWVTNENLLELLITNAHTLLDNMSSWMGSAGSASFAGVAITLISMLAVNAVFYVYMMHILYSIILSSMGYVVRPLPKLLSRLGMRQADM